jgi:transcriptional regulator with XRE-family HTH domain
MLFGLWVKTYRESRRWTQTECAKRAGMSVQQWSNMEAKVSTIRMTTVTKVARGFEISESEVISLSRTTSAPVSVASDLVESFARIVQGLPPERREAFRQMTMGNMETTAAVLASVAA